MPQPAPQSVNPQATSDLTGTTVGRFAIRARLGAGGMGEVYRADDTRLKRQVALKRIAPRLQADEVYRKRFLREAQVASGLSNQHIAGIYDVFETDSEMFVVMEYVEGETLRQWLARPLAVDQFLGIGVQCATALVAAHARGIAHLDIKPENIMLSSTGQVKILDFGVAKQLPRLDDAATMETLGGQGASGADSGGGTPAYMAPEVLLGKPADQRADIFSLGVVFYEALSGSHPFRGTGVLATSNRILHESPAPLRQANPKAPAELERIVTKMLAKDPAERYATAADLLVDLRAVQRAVKHPALAPAVPIAGAPPRLRLGTWGWAGIAGIAFAVILLALNMRGWRDRLLGHPAAARIESIAVLPLENLSHDPEQDYFADGMTDALITELSSVGALRVVSRTSAMAYRGTHKPLPQIARDLNVDAVIEGSVLRSGDHVRISAELIQASTDHSLWAKSYERELKDVLALQSELARTITQEINVKLTPAERTRLTTGRRPVNPQAYEAYLKGRYYWNKRTEEGFRTGIEYFNQAIAKDPTYAPPYAGLADSYASLVTYHVLSPQEAMPRARAAATKALEMDDQLAEAHASMARIEMHSFELASAEAEFKRAIELNPGYATAHHWLALYLAAMSRPDEAQREIQLARDLDPLSLIINANVGWCHYLARQYDQTIRDAEKTLELDSGFAVAHEYLAQAYLEKGEYERAVSEFRKLTDLSQRNPSYLAELGNACGVAGRRKEARDALRELMARSKQTYVSPYDVALIYAGMDKKNEAILWLEKAYADRDSRLLNLNAHPRFDALRPEARFQELLGRVG